MPAATGKRCGATARALACALALALAVPPAWAPPAAWADEPGAAPPASAEVAEAAASADADAEAEVAEAAADADEEVAANFDAEAVGAEAFEEPGEAAAEQAAADAAASPDAAEGDGRQTPPQAAEAVPDPAPSQAAGLVDGHEYVLLPASDQAADLALQAPGAAGGAVTAAAQTRADAQRWRARLDAAGNVELLDAEHGFALSPRGLLARAGTTVGATLALGAPAQRWCVQANDDGTITLRSMTMRTLAVQLRATPASWGREPGLVLGPARGSAAERFRLVDVTAQWQQLDELAAAAGRPLEAGQYVIACGSRRDLALDLVRGSAEAGANIRLWPSNMANAQRWNLRYDEAGYAVLVNQASGQCMTVEAGAGVAGANVCQQPDEGARAQRWLPVAGLAGTFRLVSALRPDVCLGAEPGGRSGANVQLEEEGAQATQRWTFYPASPQVPRGEAGLEPGSPFRLQAAGTQACLGAEAGAASGDAVLLRAASDAPENLFTFEEVDGYWRLVNAGTGFALEVRGGNVVSGTPVVLASRADVDRQLFSVQQGAGGLVFVNKATGLVLSPDGAAAPGAPAVGLRAEPDRADDAAFDVRVPGQIFADGVVTLEVRSDSTLVLAERGVASGSNVQLALYDGGFGQKWQMTCLGGNVYAFENTASGMMLASSGGNVAVLDALTAEDGAAQWRPVFKNGAVSWRNLGDGRMMDLVGGVAEPGRNIRTWTANNAPAQRFDARPALAVDPGVYVVHSAADQGYVLDVSGGRAENGTNVQLWSDNGLSAQKWIVVYDAETGAFLLQGAGSRKMLDNAGSGTTAGTNVHIWASNNAMAQRWRVEYAGRGSFSLYTAVAPDLALDVRSGLAENGTNVRLWGRNGAAAQRWVFEPSSLASGDTRRGIDTSRWNEGLSVAAVDADFIIQKATEGEGYTDPTFETRSAALAASGKQFGFYHFARVGDPVAQADWFVSHVRPYVGRAVLALDWENRGTENVLGQGPAWAKRWLDRVYELTGVRPVIYMSLSVTHEYDWSAVAGTYELWLARYHAPYQNAAGGVGYAVDPPVNATWFGAWAAPTIFQYTSNGRVDGFGGSVDLNILYGPAAKWAQLAAGS